MSTTQPRTDFSRRFAEELRRYMDAEGVTLTAAGAYLGRGASFVRGRIEGELAVTTDIVDGVAAASGISGPELMRIILDRMERRRGSVEPPGPRQPRSR